MAKLYKKLDVNIGVNKRSRRRESEFAVELHRSFAEAGLHYYKMPDARFGLDASGAIVGITMARPYDAFFVYRGIHVAMEYKSIAPYCKERILLLSTTVISTSQLDKLIENMENGGFSIVLMNWRGKIPNSKRCKLDKSDFANVTIMLSIPYILKMFTHGIPRKTMHYRDALLSDLCLSRKKSISGNNAWDITPVIDLVERWIEMNNLSLSKFRGRYAHPVNILPAPVSRSRKINDTEP